MGLEGLGCCIGDTSWLAGGDIGPGCGSGESSLGISIKVDAVAWRNSWTSCCADSSMQICIFDVDLRRKNFAFVVEGKTQVNKGSRVPLHRRDYRPENSTNAIRKETKGIFESLVVGLVLIPDIY